MSHYVERWWHRLLKVLLSVFVIAVATIAIFVAWDTANPYRTYYSWHEGGIPEKYDVNGLEKRCYVRDDSLGMLENCGSLYSSQDLLDDLVKHRAIKSESIPHPRTYRSDGKTADEVLRANALYTWSGNEFELKLLGVGGFWTIVAILIASLIAAGIYRLAIYIAHGGRRLIQ